MIRNVCAKHTSHASARARSVLTNHLGRCDVYGWRNVTPVGGTPAPRLTRAAHLGIAGLLGVLVVTGCGDDDSAPSDAVDSADAITAIVAWQAGEQEPVIGDDGEPELPVIFVVAGDGTTIDVGVQADVAEATNDWATVRFADRTTDTFDPDLDGEPVRDDGVMLLVGPLPEPARSIEVDLARYTAIDDGEVFLLEITSQMPTDSTDPDASPTATVTSVMQP